MSWMKPIRACSGALAWLVLIAAAWPQTPALLSPYRTWKDASGKFEVEAAVEQVDAGNVVLRLKQGAATVRVPVQGLSAADQAYVRGLLHTGKETPGPASDDVAATAVVLRRDFGNISGSTSVGILIFADEKFGYIQEQGTVSFPGLLPEGNRQLPLRTPSGSGINTNPSGAEITLPPNALDQWRATFHYGEPSEFFEMLQPVKSGEHVVRGLTKVPLGKLPTPLLARKTALPVSGSEVKIVGFHLQERAGAPPLIVRNTCPANVSPLKGDSADVSMFYCEGAGLVNISTGVVLDSQDRVLGILPRGISAQSHRFDRHGAAPRCMVTSVRTLRLGIALDFWGTDATAIYAEGWSSNGISFDLDVSARDQLGRAVKTALLIKRHAGPLPTANQTGADNWAPILPDMTAVPLSSAPVKPEHQNHLKIGFTQLAGQWQDPQPVDGQQAIRYAVQLQWADAAGKVRQSAPRIMTPRLCSRAQWNKMRGTLDRGMCLQAAPAPDGTICLTPESTRGWPGATPFVTKLDTSGPKVTSPGTKLESTAVDFGTFTCRLYNEGQRKRFRGTPVWSSDGTAFFVVTAEGLLRKIAKSDFSVLASMQLVAPPGTEPKRQPVLDLFPSSEGPIAMVADGFPVKFWVLDEETLAVKRGFGMPNMYLRSSSKSPIVYVPNINGLTIVDFSTGKVLRHLGERKKPREITEQMLWTPRVRDPMRVTPDGRYLVIPSRDSRARESLAVYRIDKDQLTFDAKAAAAMPSGMTREVMLGRALGKLAGPATGQYGARVPFDFLHGYGDPAVTVSPNGKEMVVLVEAKLCYSPQLPDISEVQQQQADLRKAREQKELAARKRREEMMNRNKSPSNSGVVVPSIRPPGVSPPPVAGPK